MWTCATACLTSDIYIYIYRREYQCDRLWYGHAEKWDAYGCRLGDILYNPRERGSPTHKLQPAFWSSPTNEIRQKKNNKTHQFPRTGDFGHESWFARRRWAGATGGGVPHACQIQGFDSHPHHSSVPLLSPWSCHSFRERYLPTILLLGERVCATQPLRKLKLHVDVKYR